MLARAAGYAKVSLMPTARSTKPDTRHIWVLLLCLVILFVGVSHAAGGGGSHQDISADVLAALGLGRGLDSLQHLLEDCGEERGPREKFRIFGIARPHVFMANAALLLLFVPVPGLTRAIPDGAPGLRPIGLTIQVMRFFSWQSGPAAISDATGAAEITIKVDHDWLSPGPTALCATHYTALLAMYAGTALASVSGTRCSDSPWRHLRTGAKSAWKNRIWPWPSEQPWGDYRRSTRSPALTWGQGFGPVTMGLRPTKCDETQASRFGGAGGFACQSGLTAAT